MSEVCFIRYKRGQIWRIEKDKDEASRRMSDPLNHLQEKTRTWLIMSVDVSNEHAPILNVLAMSTKLRVLPCHVRVPMNGFDCNVLCEHSMTINASDLDKAYYVGTIKDSYMREVEVALANQLGLSIQIPSAEQLKKFIEDLAEMKAKEIKERTTGVSEDYVSELTSKLESAFGISRVEEKSDVSVVVETQPKIKNKSNDAPSVTKTPQVEITERPAKRNKWTTENMQQFLADFEKLSSQEMGQKYGMSMKSLYTTKARFKGLLSEPEQG